MSQRAEVRRRLAIRGRRPLVEPVEPRILLATFTVTDAADAGPGSFRQAILDSDSNPAPAGQANRIDFEIGPGTQVIQPLTPLPTISELVTIDSTTSSQAGQVIQLQGDLAGRAAEGLTIDAPGVSVVGLTIVRFDGSGVLIEGDAGGDVVSGCRIGVDQIGTSLGNGGDGVTIVGTPAVTIGGTAPGAGNLISANGGNGVSVVSVAGTTPSTGDVILGNVIGRNSSTGTYVGLGNNLSGVAILGSSFTLVGDGTLGGRNFISGNSADGIQISSGDDNSILGNDIGGDTSGLFDVGNIDDGVFDFAGVGNSIGGPLPGQGNTIFGNGGSGVDLFGTEYDVVQGSTIGLNAFDSLYSAVSNRDGTPHQLGNIQDGVLINGGELVTIGGTVAGARNVISGNLKNGISIVNDSYQDAIQENFVGLDSSGLVARGNRLNGIYVASPDNVIGGTYLDASGLEQPAGNVVSGNLNSGVVLSTSSATGNLIAGNVIGSDITGGDNPSVSDPAFGVDGQPIGNRQDGVFVNDDAILNTIGGSTSADRNLISGNGSNGVQVLGIGILPAADGATPPGNYIVGNYIGTDATGLGEDGNAAAGVFLYNARDNVVGMPGAGNLITGNLGSGVAIQGGAATDNSVLANVIGMARPGPGVPGNRGDGVTVVEAALNRIGGTGPGEGNTIIGNGGSGVSVSSGSNFTGVVGNLIDDNSGDGVSVESESDGSGVVGNRIGVDPSGLLAMGNKLDGVRISSAGTQVVSDVIAANAGAGVEVVGDSPGAVIQGDAIGLATDGLTPLGNAVGVLIDGISNLTVGGTGPDDGNTISGNKVGVEVTASGDPSTPLNDLIAGNIIGLDITGEVAAGNGFGVFLDDVVGVSVGGAATGSGNVISGNTGVGVQVFRVSPGQLGDSIEGNIIGLDRDGLLVPAGADQPIGVFLNSAPDNVVSGNVISGNRTTVAGSTGFGVLISGQSIGLPLDNLVEGNTIGPAADGSPLSTSTDGLVQPIQDVGVAVNASSGNVIGPVGAGTAGNTIEGNVVGVQVAGLVEVVKDPTTGANIPSGNAIVGDVIDANTYGVFLNGTSGNEVAADDLSRNTAIGLSIVGALAQDNTATGDTISGNGSASSGVSPSSTTGDGVFISAAGDNTVVGNTIDSSGQVKPKGQSNGVGVYLFDGASGNRVASNTIRGSSAYGILVYNSAGNLGQIPRVGKGSNTIGGSGIADFREFTGPAASTTTGSTPKGPKAGKKK
jgi:parallel beta-helix repeat protein